MLKVTIYLVGLIGLAPEIKDEVIVEWHFILPDPSDTIRAGHQMNHIAFLSIRKYDGQEDEETKSLIDAIGLMDNMDIEKNYDTEYLKNTYVDFPENKKPKNYRIKKMVDRPFPWPYFRNRTKFSRRRILNLEHLLGKDFSILDRQYLDPDSERIHASFRIKGARINVAMLANDVDQNGEESLYAAKFQGAATEYNQAIAGIVRVTFEIEDTESEIPIGQKKIPLYRDNENNVTIVIGNLPPQDPNWSIHENTPRMTHTNVFRFLTTAEYNDEILVTPITASSRRKNQPDHSVFDDFFKWKPIEDAAPTNWLKCPPVVFSSVSPETP